MSDFFNEAIIAVDDSKKSILNQTLLHKIKMLHNKQVQTKRQIVLFNEKYMERFTSSDKKSKEEFEHDFPTNQILLNYHNTITNMRNEMEKNIKKLTDENHDMKQRTATTVVTMAGATRGNSSNDRYYSEKT